MFNLPWYAWLNVIALPCFWACVMLEIAANRTLQPYRKYTTVAIVACVFSVFLYWNPPLNALFSPLQIGLVALIAPLALFTLATAGIQIVATARSCVTTLDNSANVALSSCHSTAEFDPDEDDIDLDSDSNSVVETEACGRAIASLFAKNATLDDSVSCLQTLFENSLEDESPKELLFALLAQLLLAGMILIPPFYMSIQLVG